MLKGLALRMATTMKIHYLFSLLGPLQLSLIYFCKCCFFISELMFSFKFVWNCLLGSDKVWRQSQSHKDFEEYREILDKVCMAGENPESLWIANEKSMKQAKKHFNENKEKGYNCDKLFELIMPHLECDDGRRFVNQLERFPDVAKHFPALNENCMRITAISLLNVILLLLPLHRDADMMEKSIEAYGQSWDLMSFVDNSDPQDLTTINMLKVIDIEAERVGLAIYNEFQSLLDLQREKLACLKKLPNSTAPELALPGAIEIIEELKKEAKKKLKEQELPIRNKINKIVGGEEQSVGEEYFCDSRDWSAIAASYRKYRVCKLILSRPFNNENELMEYLYKSLSDVIVSCLLKLPNVLAKRCREWAVKFEEEKIWDAMCTAGKFVGVMQKCNLEVKANFQEPMFSEETQTVW